MWWKKQLGSYNKTVLKHAFIAFTLYFILGWGFMINIDPEFEITALTLFIQVIAFSVYLTLVNVLYFSGYASEWIIKPTNIFRFRHTVVKLYTALTCCVLYSIPFLMIVEIIFL